MATRKRGRASSSRSADLLGSARILQRAAWRLPFLFGDSISLTFWRSDQFWDLPPSPISPVHRHGVRLRASSRVGAWTHTFEMKDANQRWAGPVCASGWEAATFIMGVL